MLKICLVLFVMVACKTVRTDGDTKFITLAHDNFERFVNGKNILIKRVHEKHWDIFYQFHKECPASRKTAKNYRTLRQQLEKGIRIWLAPLREITNKPIVDNFVFYKSKEDDRSKPENGQQIEYEITAVFRCISGWSSADRQARIVTMRESHKNVPIFGNLPYMDHTLRHELGHVFELADTYVGNLGFSPPNAGSYKVTIGNQPKSVMSGISCEKQGGLCPDDRRAIQWLYRYHWEGLDPTKCPPEFIYEELTHGNRTVGGCIYRQPLLVEVRQKHLSNAISLVEFDKNLKINDKDKHGYAALHYIAPWHLDFDKSSFHSLLTLILDYPNIDVNIIDNYGNTPLHWATWLGNPLMVWLLLYVRVGGESPEREETKINVQNKQGMTALHIAATHGCNDCIKYLLRRVDDIKPNIKEKRFGSTPLHGAAKNGHTEIVKMLLKHKDINRNIRNRAGKTARQLAELNGHEETVKAFD